MRRGEGEVEETASNKTYPVDRRTAHRQVINVQGDW